MIPNLCHASNTIRLVSVLLATLITVGSFGVVMLGLTGEDASTALAAAPHSTPRVA